jgi:F0F1-type ATP synthase assembly protein I
MPPITDFTPTAFFVLIIFLAIGFGVGTHIDKKRLKNKLNKYPQARKMKRAEKAEVDRLLEWDENSYS